MPVKTPSKRPVLDINNKKKRKTRAQFAALPYRFGDDGLEVLLITSQRSKRWVPPKGWGEDGGTAQASAQLEAWEEAGVKGRCADRPLGVYSTRKALKSGKTVPCVIILYPMHVDKIHSDYPEKKTRKRKWFSPEKAAEIVNEQGLGQLIKMLPREIPPASPFQGDKNNLD